MYFNNSPKLGNCLTKQKEKPLSYNLDTLAQLSTRCLKTLKTNELQQKVYSRENLQKRAKAKAFTNSYLFDLIDLKSKLNKSYWQTYHCASVVLQEDNKIKSKFCNQRWCLTCNRIRTAKIINGYKTEIDKFIEPQFVTLTIPNVKEKNLNASINDMNKAFRDITKNALKTYGIKVKALRKYECTYNEIRNDFHPHYHLIVNNKQTALVLRSLWLKKFPLADIKGQHIQDAKENSLAELCKYFTKIIAKDTDYNPKALDAMFRASKDKRTFQAIGIKKQVSEDVEQIEIQEIDFKENSIDIFVWQKDFYDWVSAEGELLSEYKPTPKELKVINQEYKHQNNQFKEQYE